MLYEYKQLSLWLMIIPFWVMHIIGFKSVLTKEFVINNEKVDFGLSYMKTVENFSNNANELCLLKSQKNINNFDYCRLMRLTYHYNKKDILEYFMYDENQLGMCCNRCKMLLDNLRAYTDLKKISGEEYHKVSPCYF